MLLIKIFFDSKNLAAKRGVECFYRQVAGGKPRNERRTVFDRECRVRAQGEANGLGTSDSNHQESNGIETHET